MELRRYLLVVRQRWLIVMLTVVAGIAAGYLVTPRGVAYTSTSTIVVGPSNYLPGTGDLSNDRTIGIQSLIRTFAVMVPSIPIASDAVASAGIARAAPAVIAATKAIPVPQTQLLRITVTDPDPSVAQALADAMAEAFVAKINSFDASTSPGEGAVPSVPVYIFETARFPTAPVAASTSRNLILGALFGALAAISLAVLAEHLDITVKTVEDAERKIELPVLGAVPFVPGMFDARPGRREPRLRQVDKSA